MDVLLLVSHIFGAKLLIRLYNINMEVMACRQNGRSYLGILDDVQNCLSLLDIPFTDINNIVGSKSYFQQSMLLFFFFMYIHIRLCACMPSVPGTSFMTLMTFLVGCLFFVLLRLQVPIVYTLRERLQSFHCQ